MAFFVGAMIGHDNNLQLGAGDGCIQKRSVQHPAAINRNNDSGEFASLRFVSGDCVRKIQSPNDPPSWISEVTLGALPCTRLTLIWPLKALGAREWFSFNPKASL
jgi:hypothetical protein